MGLVGILVGALRLTLAAEDVLAKALLGRGGDQEGSGRISEESKFVLYREFEYDNRWRLHSHDDASLAASPPDTGRCQLAAPRYTPSWQTTRARRSSTRNHQGQRTIATELLGLVHPTAEEGCSAKFISTILHTPVVTDEATKQARFRTRPERLEGPQARCTR